MVLAGCCGCDSVSSSVVCLVLWDAGWVWWGALSAYGFGGVGLWDVFLSWVRSSCEVGVVPV